MRLILSLAAVCLPLMAVPAFADCADGIRDTMNRALTSGPYSTVTISKSGGVTTTLTTQMLPPSAIHARSEGTGSVTEMIVLDGKGWMKHGDVWTEMPQAMAQSTVEELSAAARKSFDDIIDAQCGGEAMVGGKGYLTFSFAHDKDGLSSKTTVLVDTGTWLPYKTLTTGTADEMAMKTVTTYSYGKTFDIVAPL